MHDGSREAIDLLDGCPDAPTCPPEWRAIVEAHQNVLFEGSTQATQSAVRMVTPYLTPPIARRCAGEALALATEPRFATLIVENVAALPPDEQARLRDWLAAGRTQVVSTSGVPLFPLVRDGLFDETLYYRLNVVRLADGPASDEAQRAASTSR